MWTRAKVKEQAKAALHRNYWKIVLVASLLFLLGCGSGGYQIYQSAHHGGTESGVEESGTEVDAVIEGEAAAEENPEQEQGEGKPQSLISIRLKGDTGETETGEEQAENYNYTITIMETVVVGVMGLALFMVLLFFSSAAVLLVDIFLLNPLSVGGSRFMIRSVEDVAQVKEIAYGFDHSYKNVAKVLFYKELYVFLWTLVFVIPGIVKMYQYYMVPYLLAEHPDLEYKTALQMSRDMMEGNKWKTFVLGLSFLLWDFFGAVTLGVGWVLYVQPYRQLTFAALYCELKNTSVIYSAGQTVYGAGFADDGRLWQEDREDTDGL